jgi:alkylation response protein AidB-like acyl-CoA dehydrogenase
MQEVKSTVEPGSRDASLVDAAQSLSVLIESQAGTAESQRHLTDDVVQALRHKGLYGTLVPKCLGGHESDLVTALLVSRELVRADGSVGWCFMAQMCWNSAVGAYMGDSAVKEIFKNDNADIIIAGQGMPNGTAEKVDGGYIVNGNWRFGSGITHAEYVQFGCIVTNDGIPQFRENGGPLIRLCATTPDKIEIKDDWYVMGLSGTGSYDYSVKDLFISDDYSYDTDETVPLRVGMIYTLGLKNTTALGHTSFALGVGRRALDELIELVGQKRPSPYGSIGDSPGFQKEYAIAEMQLRSITALAIDSWGDIQKMLDKGDPPDMKQIAIVRALTRYAHEVAADVIGFAYKIGGGASLRGGALQRCFRDIHAGTQHVLVSHQIAEAAGKVMLGNIEENQKWGLLGIES